MVHPKFTPEKIENLDKNEIFVFGSNLQGKHAGGAARVAREKFGAIIGKGVGLQGQSYAIPTMQGGVETIRPYVAGFAAFAKEHPELTFYVTPIGCGIAGFQPKEIAPLFDVAFDLPNVILPESFFHIINHMRQLASETEGMVFHSVPIEYYPEDAKKMETMSHDELIDFVVELKKNGRYKVKHDNPECAENIFNTTSKGCHLIAITSKIFAIIADNKLYSNDFKWGLTFPCQILSVVANEANDEKYPQGQFIVLLADGTIAEVWSESCIKHVSKEKDFIGIASGCNGVIFGLKKDGTVKAFNTDKNPTTAEEISGWTDICQIEAGPRHIAGLKSDGTVVVAGESSHYFDQISKWRNIVKIHTSRSAVGYNDVTYGIDKDGWLYIDGYKYLSKPRDYWRKIQSQYDVTDVIDNGQATLVRLSDGSIRFMTPRGLIHYEKDFEFLGKYKGFKFIESYKGITVLVDKNGELKVTKNQQEVKWWSFNLDTPVDH